MLPVFQTPYHADETIDYATLEREINWLYDCGAQGVVMAMVSELLRLSNEERVELAEATCRFGRARGVVIISVGAESSKVSERFARQAESAGADSVMTIPPVSVGVGESELAAYYYRIIQTTSIPVIMQDASGYVGKPMTIGLQARRLALPSMLKLWNTATLAWVRPAISVTGHGARSSWASWNSAASVFAK